MIKIKFVLFLIFTILLIFFQDMAIKLGNQVLYIAPFFIVLCLVLIYLSNGKVFLRKIGRIYKYSNFKYLLLFVIWALISAFSLGSTVAIKSVFRIILIYFLTAIPAFLFPILILSKYISYKRILKLFIKVYNFIMLYGIFHYISQLLGISFLANIHNIFSSKQFFIAQASGDLLTIEHLQATGVLHVRAMSVFFEPSFFATFIFLFLPFVYNLATSYEYKNTTKFIVIALTWINLFLTMSPIYIVACLVYTLFYFRKKLFRLIYRYWLVTLIIISCLSIYQFFNIETQANIEKNRIIDRIENTIKSFGSLERLVDNEPSLATRMIVNIIGFQIGLSHPIKGVGYGNVHDYALQALLSTSMPLTPEIIKVNIINERVEAPPSIFFSILCQTGFVGIAFLYIFFISSILQGIKILRRYSKQKDILFSSMILIAINYVIISFYWSFDSYPLMWFIFGTLNSYIYNYKIYNKTWEVKD